MKVRLSIVVLSAVAVLGACGQEAATKSGGTVKPAASAESTVTTSVPSTTATTAKATTSTTAQPATTSTTGKSTTTTTENVTTTTAPAVSSVSYANCSAAKAAGAAPIYRGQPGYSSNLDRDRDGVACES